MPTFEHPFLPQTDADTAAMLSSIGVASADDLFASIPADLRLKRPLDLPAQFDDYLKGCVTGRTVVKIA